MSKPTAAPGLTTAKLDLSRDDLQNLLIALAAGARRGFEDLESVRMVADLSRRVERALASLEPAAKQPDPGPKTPPSAA